MHPILWPLIKSYTKNCQHSSTILIRNGRGGGLSSFSVDALTYADGDQQIDVTHFKQIIHRGVPRLSDLPSHSCNGLILISHHATAKSWVIWNPLLQDFHVLAPPSIDDSLSEYGLMRTGFGYDYKVVRVHKLHVGEGYRSFVYSLKSRGWRVIQGFPGDACLGEKGVLLKGALHWRSREGIIAFRVGKEDHVVLPRPPTVGMCWALATDIIIKWG
ncbi:hypothetical protein C2S51_000991 [Perilla frutescens var. frutescens]|nr:hypothetical protein C2S51_000991 [Perilla frutescens var. frutescens]